MAREANERRIIERKTGLSAESAPVPSPILKFVCERWQEKMFSRLSPQTIKNLKIYTSKHIIPTIGHDEIKRLKSETILPDLLRPIERVGHLDTAHRIKSVLSRILRFAVAEGLIADDATRSLNGMLAPINVKHRPAILDLRRIGRLMLDIRNYTGGPVVAMALRILPYVFVRPGELRKAEWSEFDLGNGLWMIPAERMKMRSPHIVPLSIQGVKLLE